MTEWEPSREEKSSPAKMLILVYEIRRRIRVHTCQLREQENVGNVQPEQQPRDDGENGMHGPMNQAKDA